LKKTTPDRFTTQADVQHKLSDRSILQFKSSYSYFDRRITIPTSIFEGVQQSSYTEFNINTRGEKTFWIAGVNFLTDDFNEQQHSATALRNYHYNTFGAFIQNTWTPVEQRYFRNGLRRRLCKAIRF
jgi:outer membrane receptor for ferrienterochelin and colicins